MLHKKQHIWSFIVACFVLLVGMYTTYEKADSFAKRTIVIDSTVRDEAQSVQKIIQSKNITVQEHMYLLTGTSGRMSELIRRFTGRTSSIRRDLRLSLLVLWGIITAYFLLQYFQEEEILCLHEKEYWRALIKYIHDIDGKKRLSCLT